MHETKLIIDPTDRSIKPLFWPLFWEQDFAFHRNIFAENIDYWREVFDRACKRGCPSYILPVHPFSRAADGDGKPVTTMLYPIALSSMEEEIIGTLKGWGVEICIDPLFSTFAPISALWEIGHGTKIDQALSSMRTFCLSLPIQKVIRFGESEAMFWTPKLRKIYADARGSLD